MDAYAFATTATPAALDQLRTMVDDEDLRVMLPMAGAYAAYAAASAGSAEDLFARISAVQGVSGLQGVTILVAAGPGGPPASSTPVLSVTPTWLETADVVGFALLRTQPGGTGAVAQLAAGVSGVIGLAIAAAAVPTVLVEVTADTTAEVNAIFDQLGGLVGVVSSATSLGFADLGRGFRRR